MNTLLLNSTQVAELLSIEECMEAVEDAFALYAQGKAMPPAISGIRSANGGFHIKSGILQLQKYYFASKINANFPDNPLRHNLPSIQGIVILCEASTGIVLALMDSIQITRIRTGAATGVAAKYLSVPQSNVVTICGCGNQGIISLEALMVVRSLKKVFAYDINPQQITKFIALFDSLIEVEEVDEDKLADALYQSDIVITCTPSKVPFICKSHIRPGTFIAAVGADSEEKQELFSELLVSNKVVVDVIAQSAAIGEVHHAVQQGLMNVCDIHAELGVIITGQKAGRESESEIIIFDSTGMALQDVASAAIVYEKACATNIGATMDFMGNSLSQPEAPQQHIPGDETLRLWFPFK
jgi:alanine dehydrogenase